MEQLIAAGGLLLFIALVYFIGRAEKSRLFREDTPESLFDDLFANLVKDKEGWEFKKLSGSWVRCTHYDTGVFVKFDTISSKRIFWGFDGCIALPDGTRVVINEASKDRFLKPLYRLLELRNRLSDSKSMAEKKERDLKSLRSMINAYKRMEAKYMHD